MKNKKVQILELGTFLHLLVEFILETVIDGGKMQFYFFELIVTRALDNIPADFLC
jgi:hypothetical protein